MEIWYTARDTYDSTYEIEGSWEAYIEGAGFYHVKELVSLDSMLNEPVFEPDLNSEHNWEFLITEENRITGFYNSLDFVLKHTKNFEKFNLLAVIKEPVANKENSLEQEWDFVGYDLIDKYYFNSALTNCGGFDETFLPSELNEFGLISDFKKAKEIQVNLFKNNPGESHADCYLFEVWRHKKIGR